MNRIRALTNRLQLRNVIAGVKPRQGATFPVFNPCTGEQIAQQPNSQEDALLAMQAAANAEEVWRKVPILERCDAADAIASGLEVKKPWLAE